MKIEDKFSSIDKYLNEAVSDENYLPAAVIVSAFIEGLTKVLLIALYKGKAIPEKTIEKMVWEKHFAHNINLLSLESSKDLQEIAKDLHKLREKRNIMVHSIWKNTEPLDTVSKEICILSEKIRDTIVSYIKKHNLEKHL